MKQKFSIKWKASKQPRKQKKYRANAPLHIRHKMVSVNFSKELRKRHGKRNIPVVKGDNVRILRGGFKGKLGKVDSVDLKKMKVVVEGIYRTKKDGTKVTVYLDPSNLQLKDLNLDDKKRKEVLARNAGSKKESTDKDKSKDGKVKKEKNSKQEKEHKSSDKNLKDIEDKSAEKENAPEKK